MTDENSIVDYLKAQGLPSDMEARRIIAVRHGIAPYTGTAEQNIRLLALLRKEWACIEFLCDEWDYGFDPALRIAS